jgi:hypothetical protein
MNRYGILNPNAGAFQTLIYTFTQKIKMGELPKPKRFVGVWMAKVSALYVGCVLVTHYLMTRNLAFGVAPANVNGEG